MATTLPTDRSILVMREFAAPPHAVFRAWTEPDLIRRWWGGGEGVVTVADVDLRVGGSWRVVVAGDGYEVGSHGFHHEIVPGARIVRTEVDEGAPESEVLCTYTVAGSPVGCAVTLLTELRSADDRDALLDSGMETGLQASWDLLERVAWAVR